jgi:hypothetical protein
MCVEGLKMACLAVFPMLQEMQSSLEQLEQQPLWDEFLAFKLSTVVHLDPSVAISSSDSQKLRMLEADACVDQWTMDNPVWPPPFPDESIACPAAAAAAENQCIYGEVDLSSSCSESPVAASKTVAPSSTPATLAKPRPTVLAAAESTPDFLKNTDLHGLEPALSVRTRILLACHAMNRMSMSLDIAKSFAIAGYFPRVRCVVFR